MKCLSCSAETTNGLALCELCRKAVEVNLEFIPVYFRNLARWRPGRAGSNSVPGSRPPTRTFTPVDRISDALDLAGNALTTWALKLEDDRGVRTPTGDASEAETVTALCTFLTEHLISIATLDWCGELVADLAEHERKLRVLTETAVPGWYGGACRICGTDTFVVPGLTWVTCGGCGATTYARDHVDAVLEEASEWVAGPKQLAATIVALVDTEMSVPRLYDRIRQWSSRGQIIACWRVDRDGDPTMKTYRLGTVLKLLAESRATRASASTPRAS